MRHRTVWICILMGLLLETPHSWGEGTFLFLEQTRVIHEQVFYGEGKGSPRVFTDFYQGYSFQPEQKLLRYNLNPEGGYAFVTELDIDACEVILGRTISSEGNHNYKRMELAAFDPRHRIRHVESYVPLHLLDGQDKPVIRDSIEIVQMEANGQVTLYYNNRKLTLTPGESTRFEQKFALPIQQQLLELEPEKTRERALTLYKDAVSVSYIVQDIFTNWGWCPKTNLTNARLPRLVGDTLYYVSEHGNQYGLYQFDTRTQVTKRLKTTTDPIVSLSASSRTLIGTSRGEPYHFALNPFSLEELDLKGLDIVQNAIYFYVQNSHILWLNEQSNLYLYDARTRRRTYLGGATGRITPQIDQHYVVWEDAPVPKTGEMVAWDLVPEIPHEVTVYDINTGQRLKIPLKDPNEDEGDKINQQTRFSLFHDAQLAWVTYRKDDMERSTVLHVLNVDTRVHTKYRIPEWHSFETPEMDGQKIVWQGVFNNFYTIYLYDLRTQQFNQLSDGQSNCYYPTIANGKVAWQSDKDGNYNIYLYDLKTGDVQPIPVE